ncbi:MAG: efflux RND transporter periplasmic adaptor subunit [bacterium]|nr:efflux RND transporter periplasmic adaptor subunit [bacterium]
MRTIKLGVILLLSFFIFIFIGCSKQKAEMKDPNADAVHVEVAEAIQQDFQRVYRASGEIEPIQSAAVSPDISGKLVKLLVQEGSYVRKGQVLAQLDDIPLTAQYEQAKAALKLAEANLEKARTGVRPQELEIAKQAVQQAKVTLNMSTTDLARTENLYKAGVATKQELDAANVRVKVAMAQYQTALENLKLAEEGARKEDKLAAEAGYEQAKAAVELVKDQLDKTRIRSPFDGIITKKYHDIGEVVMPSVPVFRVETVNPMKAVIRIPQEDVGQIKLGQMASITLPTYEIVTGKVSLISPAVEAGNRSVKIEISVDNPNRNIKSGMFIRAEILIDTFKGAIIIPKSAVQKTPDGKNLFIYTVQNNLAKRTPITVKLIQDETVVVDQGITAGVKVVIRGADRLTDNTKVKL